MTNFLRCNSLSHIVKTDITSLMSRLVKLLVLLFFLLVADSVFPYSSIYNGSLCPESFGAKGDGSHDDTKAIQTLLDSLDKIGGGTMYLGSGTYMVTSIHLGKKTSAVGCGNGATLIKQIKGIKAACVIVQPMSAALNISNLTIVGNNDNIGLMIENTSDGQENHLYLYNKGIKDGVPQPYKWMTIDNICIYHFETGLNIENKGYISSDDIFCDIKMIIVEDDYLIIDIYAKKERKTEALTE